MTTVELSICSRAKRGLYLQLKRLIIFVLVVGMTIGIHTTLNNKQASAWTGALPSCQYADALNWAWKEAITAVNPIHDVDNTNLPWVMRSTTTNPTSGFIDITFASEIEFIYGNNTTQNGIQFTGSTVTYGIAKNVNDPNYQDGVYVNSSPTGSITHSQACITAQGNTTQEQQYIDEGGITYNNVAPAQQYSCEALDVICHVANIFQNVKNTFASVGLAIVNGFASLFIPDSDVFTQFHIDMTEFLVQKLGFLVYPVEWLADIWDGITSNSNNWCTETSCSQNFGNLFGQPFVLDMLVVKNSIPQYWNLLVYTIRGVTVLTLIITVSQKLRSILRGQ